MNILVYIEPWIEKSKPNWKDIWIESVLYPIFHNLVKHNSEHKIDIMFVIGDAQNALSTKLQFIDNSTVRVITQKSLRGISANYIDATIKQHLNTFSSVEMESMVKICQNAIGDFKPDLIFSFMTRVCFLKKLFPNTLIIYQEVGMISREPYPTTYFLDPFGTFSECYIGKFTKEFNGLRLDSQKESFLEEFRKIYLTNSIQASQPFSRNQLDPDFKFEYLVLLPLQIDPYFSFNAYVEFKDQFDYICYVMDRIDPRIGVVITTHSDWFDYSQQDGLLEYIERTYPNAILNEKFNAIRYCSQYLLDIVDGVISISSTVGLQALIHKKPLFVVGNNKQLLNLCETDDIAKVWHVLSESKYKNKDAILYHLLTHYYILNEPYILNGKWLYKFFTKCIKKFKDKKGFDFFDKIDEDGVLLQHFSHLARPTAFDNTVENKKVSYFKRGYRKARGVLKKFSFITD